VAQVRAHEAEFRVRGATLAAIGLGDLGAARQFREESGIGFPLLLDERREAYRGAGLGSGHLWDVVRPENWTARARARAAGHRQHRTGQHPFQLGGSFVLGPGPVDRLVHRSRTFGDNATPAALLAALP
jgi:hypothetical protein